MDWNNINTDRDTSGLGPIEYDQSRVPSLIRKHADNVRTKTYGQEVREAQARNAELAGLIASEADSKADSADTIAKDTQNRFDRQIAGSTYDNEVIDARGEFVNLYQRLNHADNSVSTAYINVKYPPAPFVPAQGDGVTDDTAVLQAMIDYGQDNGVPVYLPRGTYLANLKLTGWGHRVYGAFGGENPTELKPYDKTIPTITDGGVMLRHSDISHLKLSGEGAVGLELTRNSYLDSYSNIVIENFDIGVKIANSWGVNFDSLEVKNNVIGVQIDTEIAVNLINFTNSKISGNEVGLDFVKNIGHNIKLDSVSLEGNQTAIQIASYYGSLIIDNCYFETNNKHLVGLSNSTSSFGVVQISNSWVYLDADSQLGIQSQIQSFIFEGNEVLASKPIDTILSFNQASIVKFDNNVVSQSGNLSNYITGIDNITTLDANQQLRVGGTMMIPKKIFGNIGTRDIKSTSGQIQKFDPAGYTTSSSRLVDVTQVGEASVDTGFVYSSGTKIEKTSGRLEVKGVSLLRGGRTIVNTTVNSRGQITLHGGIQYVYTIDRPKNLTISERGYLIYDRDLNKLLTYVHSESTTGWKDSMGNDA